MNLSLSNRGELSENPIIIEPIISEPISAVPFQLALVPLAAASHLAFYIKKKGEKNRETCLLRVEVT